MYTRLWGGGRVLYPHDLKENWFPFVFQLNTQHTLSVWPYEREKERESLLAMNFQKVDSGRCTP